MDKTIIIDKQAIEDTCKKYAEEMKKTSVHDFKHAINNYPLPSWYSPVPTERKLSDHNYAIQMHVPVFFAFDKFERKLQPNFGILQEAMNYHAKTIYYEIFLWLTVIVRELYNADFLTVGTDRVVQCKRNDQLLEYYYKQEDGEVKQILTVNPCFTEYPDLTNIDFKSSFKAAIDMTPLWMKLTQNLKNF